MKLSISLPDTVGREIRGMAHDTEKPVSVLIQKAWQFARSRLLQDEAADMAQHRRALKKMRSLKGSLKKYYPNTTSTRLASQAFSKEK